MTDKLRRLSFNTRAGLILVLCPIPRETRNEAGDLVVDPWGDLAPLLEVPEMASLIPVVTGEAFSDALHGWFPPFMASMGPEPSIQLRRIPQPLRPCALRGECGMHKAARCQPQRRTPECWVADVPPAAQRPVSQVVHAWLEGRYVVVVEGPEFSLKGGQ
jgi:hypothetical protein